ncbi:MAG: hypothetical protein RMA76_23375 [Deltaproteobacteria bacterium]|jgi:hypothetical protein
MKHVLAFLFVAGFLVSLGCASDAALDAFGTVPVECQTTDQCNIDEVCVELRCVDREMTQGPDAISIEVTPPSDSPYTRYQRLDIPIVNAAQTLVVRMPEPVPYEAVVVDAAGERVEADLVVYGANRIPGRELEVNTTVRDDTENGARFSLVEGNYAARIRPDDRDRPGIEVTGFSVRTGAELPKEFALPTRYRQIQGRVTLAQSSQEGLPGAIVRAIGEKSRLESTIAIADENGDYAIRLPETTDTFFRVNAMLPSEQQPAWGFSQSVLVDPEGDRALEIAIERSSDDNRGTVSLSIVGLDELGQGSAVADAKVTFTASVAVADRLTPPAYRITGLTDARGQVHVNVGDDRLDVIPLLRSRYIVEVLPPAGSSFARLQTVLDFRSAGQNFTIDEQLILALRPTVIGEVSSAGGRPVRARVDFDPLDDTLRARDAQTSADGRFAIDLDPGRYLMVVRPDDPLAGGERLPVDTVVIEIPDTTGDHALPPIRLPPGNEVFGSVRGGIDGEVVEDARVEMFVYVEGQTVSLGEDFSGSDGTFSIVLPIPQ